MTPEEAIYERCWCWQYGRCLTDCPTADLPRPVPFTEERWRSAALTAQRRDPDRQTERTTL